MRTIGEGLPAVIVVLACSLCELGCLCKAKPEGKFSGTCSTKSLTGKDVADRAAGKTPLPRYDNDAQCSIELKDLKDDKVTVAITWGPKGTQSLIQCSGTADRNSDTVTAKDLACQIPNRPATFNPRCYKEFTAELKAKKNSSGLFLSLLALQNKSHLSFDGECGLTFTTARYEIAAAQLK